MQPSSNPDEAVRLEALRRYRVLDTPPEESFDTYTRLAAHICGTSISLISLVDEHRLWFKSSVGLDDLKEIPSARSFCSHCILDKGVLTVPDTCADLRFCHHPLVNFDPYIRFYAGAPLVTGQGQALGTLCVLDTVPREMTVEQTVALQALADEVMRHLEIRRKNLELEPMRKRLELILNAAGEGIYGLDREGKTTFVNPAAERMLHWSAADLLGRNMHDVLHHSYENGSPYPQADCPIYKSLNEGASCTGADEVFWRRDGSCFFTHYTCSPIIENNERSGVVVVFEDITRRKHAENKIQSQEAQLRLITDALPALICYIDKDLRYQFNNKAYEDWFGLKSEQLQGRPVQEILGASAFEQLSGNMQQALAGHANSCEVRLDYRFGGQRDTTVSYIPDIGKDGAVNGFIGLIQNVSERRQAEQALRLSEERYRALYENNPAMYFTLDSSGTVLSANQSGAEQLGYSADELVGRPGLATVYEDDKALFLHTLQNSLAQPERIGHSEFRKVRRDGSILWVKQSLRPVRAPDNSTVILTVSEDITDYKRAEAKLKYQAHYDALTGLPNRILFYDRLQQAMMRRTPWSRRRVAVLFLDLDNFKIINDTLGHVIADLLLRSIGERLSGAVREGDTIARLGGDEFSIILADLGPEADAIQLAEKVLASLALPFHLDSHELFVTASIGISLYPEDGEDPESLLKNADTAMYSAKEQGRNRYQHYSSALGCKASARLSMEISLRHALTRDEFVLHYQPQIDLVSGRIIAVEALLRWQKPRSGLISAAQFIDVAEDSGLIVPIGEWVLRTACQQNRRWQAMGLPAIRMGVNMSARQFQQRNMPDVVKYILQVLEETGLAHRYLELELTESILHTIEAAGMLRMLKDTGIQIAIDDFGTGYSSLSYLKQFPLDKLKIDQSFMHDIPGDTDNLAITTAIVAMAHSLKLKVIAEGVETQEQLDFLRTLSCDEIQGYLFSKPVCAAELEALLVNNAILET